MSGEHALAVSRAALHELLTDAHVALIEHRPEWAGAVLHTLRRITAPDVVLPQGRAARLKDEGLVAAATMQGRVELPGGTPPADVPAVPEAATAAPPTIDLPGGPGSGADTPAPTPPEAGAAPQPPAPEPAQAAGGPIIRDIGRKPSGGHRPVSVWTDARTAKLRELWPTCMDDEALLEILNEMPGQAIASVAALRTKAHALDVRRTAETLDALARRAGHKGGANSVAAKPAADQGMRTPERMELLRTLWGDPSLTVPMIHGRICALPGPKPAASQVLYQWARRLGLPTQRPLPTTTPEQTGEEQDLAEPEGDVPAAAPADAPAHDQAEEQEREEQPAAPEPEPQPEAAPPPPPSAPVTASPADEKAEAFDAFASGLTVRDVATDFGLPLSTLANWHAEWKLLTKANAA